MKSLKDILYKTGIEELIGSTSQTITSITFDSRTVGKSSLFIAVRGTQVDGHHYIDKAISCGAIAIVCEEIPKKHLNTVTYIRVQNSAKALGHIAANFYDHPSKQLKLIGVTGTNGKTTIATLLYDLLSLMGYKCGLFSTVVNKIGTETIPSTHTTPDAIQLNKLLQQMVNEGCEYCFMEVSSHAVVQERITGLSFTGGIFTNLTHDHLDFHKTFKEYLEAKKRFFDELPQTAFALTNKDDKNGLVMTQNTKAQKKTYALKSPADFKVKLIESHFSGMLLNMDNNEIWTKLIGHFNAYNLLAIYGCARLLNLDKLEVLTAISELHAVDGRFQYIRSTTNISGIVDYAHTPDALKNVLDTIKEIRTGNEQLITVIGCGGDRDRTKRPLMAKIACQLSDKVILTSDNPRSEEPEAIIKEMSEGVEPQHFKKVLSITDRKEAIKTACTFAEAGDIILIAGKGHEKYQEIKGKRYPFDDVKVVEETFKLLEK